jgi:hypothetical protein
MQKIEETTAELAKAQEHLEQLEAKAKEINWQISVAKEQARSDHCFYDLFLVEADHADCLLVRCRCLCQTDTWLVQLLSLGHLRRCKRCRHRRNQQG